MHHSSKDHILLITFLSNGSKKIENNSYIILKKNYCHFRSSCPRGVLWKGVLRNFAKFTGKHLRTPFFTEHLWWLLLPFERGFFNDTIGHFFLLKLNSEWIVQIVEAVIRRCSLKLVSLKICKFHRKAAVLESLFNKVANLQTRYWSTINSFAG